jgi:hypothetical protein
VQGNVFFPKAEKNQNSRKTVVGLLLVLSLIEEEQPKRQRLLLSNSFQQHRIKSTETTEYFISQERE